MHANPTRIFFETTGTSQTRVNTGIQRVVRSLVREARRAQAPGGPRVIPVTFQNGHFHDATDTWTRILRWQDRGGQTILSRLGVAIERVSPAAARLSASVLTRLRKALYPKTLVRWAGVIAGPAADRRVTFGEDDVLLLLDASWGHAFWPSVLDARRRGSRVGAVVYDLLPVEYPQFFKSPFPAVFTNWLDNLVDHSEFFLAISETVRGSLETYVRSSRSPEAAAAERFQAFRLGADFPRSSSPDSIRPALRRLYRGDRGRAPYLAVGTIEPRKNHHYLLDAFDLLWRRCPAAQLCIVGRIGWQCCDVLDRFARHPQSGKSLFVFHDLSDNELQYCYERAKALVTTSVAEGFGLPLVEALGRGLPVFASDIPVYREVGGAGCGYFDLRSAGSLAALLAEVEQRGTPLALPPGEHGAVTSWSESFRDLMTKTLQLQARVLPADLPGAGLRAPPAGPRARAA